MSTSRPETTGSSSINTLSIVAALLVLSASVIVAAIIVYHANKHSDEEMLRVIEQAVSKVQNKGLTFEDERQFEAAVAKAVESLVARRREQNVQQLYSRFELAPEEVPSGKKIYGDINATFTLVEFSDLECPYCKQYHATLEELVKGSNGNVNWQWKHMPLAFHNPAAKHQAVAAECVAEQKGNRAFWAFLDQVFEQTRGNGQGVKDLAALATSVGADETSFQECMAAGRYEKVVEDDMKMAQSAGITGTPATYIVDNRTGNSVLIKGKQPAASLVSTMQRMIKAQNQ